MKNFVEMKDLIPAKNTTPYARILAIGDVHGCFDKLISLWEKISVTEKDLVIFLGDYIGDSEDNFKTLAWLAKQNQKPNVIVLPGNVDFTLKDYLESETPSTPEDAALFKGICNFIESLPLYCKIKIGGREYFFCHGGINPNEPLDAQRRESLIGYDLELFIEKYHGDAVIIMGHKSPRKIMQLLPQFKELDTLKPARVPTKNILLLDTRAKDLNGYLSCVDILTGEFWQS